MKKLVLSLAVLAGMTMVACGSSENNAENADSAAVEAPVEAVEAAAPCCNDTDNAANSNCSDHTAFISVSCFSQNYCCNQ